MVATADLGGPRPSINAISVPSDRYERFYTRFSTPVPPPTAADAAARTGHRVINECKSAGNRRGADKLCAETERRPVNTGQHPITAVPGEWTAAHHRGSGDLYSRRVRAARVARGGGEGVQGVPAESAPAIVKLLAARLLRPFGSRKNKNRGSRSGSAS